IRGVIRSAHIAPNEADARAFIIDGADTLSAACQNALLKLLEEPPAHTGFILRCEEPGALLPTVRSRCHITASDEPEPFADKRFSELAESFLRAVKRGGSALTVMSFELEKLSREDFAELLSALLSAAASAKRECALSGADAPEYLLRIELVIAAAERYLVHNLSAGHVAAKICAELMPE
ncbi:MAG: hypothetical protein LBC78_01410, partial [Oscillospiraceae bacterium]|nr:hypothetical protein [Oscillospiraceae bacterium]